MEVNEDRRRHRRFDTQTVSASLSMIETGEHDLVLTHCKLLNVSYGGMCFRTSSRVKKNCAYRFLVDLRAPFEDVVMVRARISWVQEQGPEGELAGAEFLESSKGWLGPEEEGGFAP